MQTSIKYWHTLENDNRIQCDLCPKACKLKDGQRGTCYVRIREKDQIILTTYGLSSSLAVDPIEKKPLYHFLPGTNVLSLGTIGCNLSCKFCQNWNISKAHDSDMLSHKIMPKNIAEMAKRNDCKSVAFTYNEPTIFMEYAIDTAKECHKLGIKTIAVTNGYICDEPRREFYKYIDAANVDLKSFSNEFYKKITAGILQPVLDTLVYIKYQTDTWLEVTTLLIPDENDSDEELDQLTKWIVKNLGSDVPIHFSTFFPTWKMTDKPPTTIETVKRAREIAMKNGIHYAYTGNVLDAEGSNTYCYNCKKSIIERDGYTISNYRLTDSGDCEFCNTLCSGVF